MVKHTVVDFCNCGHHTAVETDQDLAFTIHKADIAWQFHERDHTTAKRRRFIDGQEVE